MADGGIDSDLICGICGQILRDPYILPCDHSFCKSPCLLPPFDQSRRTVCCPICFIEVDICEMSPNRELSSRLRSLDVRASTTNPPRSHNRAQCPVCHNVCQTLTHCGHCRSQVCGSCAEQHLVTLRNSVISRRASLMSLRYSLINYRTALATTIANTEKADAHKAALSAGIEEATEGLNHACAQALERSLGDLTAVNLQASELLELSREQLFDASQIYSLLSCQLLDMKSEEDMHTLMVFQEQASCVLNQIEVLIKNLSKSKSHECFDSWKVSKTFETIGDQLASMNLVVCDVFQSSDTVFSSFRDLQPKPKDAPSFLSEYIATFRSRKKFGLPDAPDVTEMFS
ncbi:hypothetical protein SprV_0100193900 [Sparganum proliferum]